MPARLSCSALVAAALGLASLSGPAAADWTSTSLLPSGLAIRAGFSNGVGFETMWFGCESAASGTLDLVFTGFDRNLSREIDHTVVVTVDGVAYLQATRARADEAEGGADLVRTAPFAEFRPLIEALKKGRSVEISSPTGRTTLPLTGSGKALTALQASCGG